jgi:hypothetical protein
VHERRLELALKAPLQVAATVGGVSSAMSATLASAKETAGIELIGTTEAAATAESEALESSTEGTAHRRVYASHNHREWCAECRGDEGHLQAQKKATVGGDTQANEALWGQEREHRGSG